MKKCSECGQAMKELTTKTPENVTYSYYKCERCNEEIVDMSQLHEVAIIPEKNGIRIMTS